MTALDAMPGWVITRDHAAAEDSLTRLQLPLKLLTEVGEPVEDLGDSLGTALRADLGLVLHRHIPQAEIDSDPERRIAPRRPRRADRLNFEPVPDVI
jgi:hypothetical protein